MGIKRDQLYEMGHGENFSENFKKEIAKIINFRFL